MANVSDINNITPKVETSVLYMKDEKYLKSRNIYDDIATLVTCRNEYEIIEGKEIIIELKEISKLQPSSYIPPSAGYYIYDMKPI